MRNLKLELLIDLSKKFFEIKEKGKEKKERRRRGRPRTYHDYLILALLLFKTSKDLSFRDTEDRAKEETKENIPHFSSIHYRFNTLDEKIVKEFISFVGEEIMEKEGRKEFRYVIVDGTGFGYNELYPMKLERGKRIREIKSHVRVCAIAGLMRGGKRVILGVEAGKAYSSEINLLKSLLKDMKFRGFYFIGDKGYDSKDIIKEIKKKGFKPVIKIKETFRVEVRDELRKEAKSYSMRENLYKIRSRIEGVFGSIKQALGSYERTTKENLARLYSISKFAIYNVYILINFLFFKIFSLLFSSIYKFTF